MQASSDQSVQDTSSSERIWTLVLSGCLGVLVVVILNLAGPWQIKSVLPSGDEVVSIDFSRILIDWSYFTDQDGNTVNERNWFSIQAFMWVALFIGFGESFIRWRALASERATLRAGILPEDDRTMLAGDDLKSIYQKARGISRTAVLPTLVRRLTMEFRKSRSAERVGALLQSSLELFMHRLDLRYTLLRYLVWLIPTLGFVGTVIGIADAMAFAGSGVVDADQLLTPTTQRLAVAFHTTLVALLQSGVLVLLMNSLQSGEEAVINESGQYCLENLVMRLLEPAHLEHARGTAG